MTSELHAPLPLDVAERALAESNRVLAEIREALVGAPAAEVRRVWPLVRMLRKAKAGALLALRDQPVARAPRAAARPAPRQRERRSKASPVARPVRYVAAVAVFDDGGGDGTGGDDDDSEPAQGQERAA